jgi:nucleotide-binding universal stress UspA family protein
VYSKIIIGFDGSDQADDALALAQQLAKGFDSELIVAHVALLNPLMRGGIDELKLEQESDFAERAEAAAGAAGARLQTIESTSPGRGLHQLAEEIGADLIVVGSSQHGRLGQTLVGNVAAALLHGASCEVAVAPKGYRNRKDDKLSTIVLGYDGLPESELAIEPACELARATGATLEVVAVADPPAIIVGKGGGATAGWRELRDAVEEQLRLRLEAARALIPDDVAVELKLIEGKPATVLAELAQRPGVVIVVGSRSYGPVRRVLLGSVSRRLVDRAPAPVIVHPRGVEDRAEPLMSKAAGATT